MKAIYAAAFTALLLLAGGAPIAGASTGPFVLFISYEARHYSPGEVVNFTVQVFGRGEPAAPDGPPAVIVQGGPGAGRAIPVSARAAGAWAGNYTVLAADADSGGRIELEALAYFRQSGGGESPYYAGLLIDLADLPAPPAAGDLSIRSFLLECPDGAIRPGSLLRIQVCATFDGAPVLPGDIGFWMSFRPDTGKEERTDLAADESAPGRFMLPFTVPAKAQSGYFQLHAASHGVPDWYVGYFSLDFFNVLYHETGRTGSRIDYELLVSDRSGNPVNGSDVVVWLASYEWDIGPVALDLGKTDRSGRVRGLADLGPGVGEFNLRGWANSSKASQYFSGTIRVSNTTAPIQQQGGQFYIERLAPAGTLSTGGGETLSYRARFESAPLPRQALDCYVQVFRGGYGAGVPEDVQGLRVVTGDDGSFTINVTLPAGTAGYAIVTAVGPGPPYPYGYTSSSDRVTVAGPPAPQPAPRANATFSAASPGAPVRICASAPGGDLVSARAFWKFSYNESSLDRPWLALNTFTWYLPARHRDGSPLKGQMVLPRHLKSGQNLTVDVSFTNATGQTTTASFPLRVRSAAAAEPPADVCCIASIFVVNALLIVLLFFNYLSGRRGEKRTSLEELDADGQIGAVLASSRPARKDLSLPIKVELARSEDCTACGRRIAQGNLAWRCVCGARFHEHCAGDGTKCPSCGRAWK
jgi:hypothetical protein